MFVMHLLVSIGFQVELPMVLEMDNKGAVDLANNWTVGGRTRHQSVRKAFLRELKEQGLLSINWILTDSNEADLYTKNLNGATFVKHCSVFTGMDEYMSGYN